jgi:ABC-type multidrug transport system fused ATPase/permease subunit
LHIPLYRYLALLRRYLRTQRWRVFGLAVLLFGEIGLQLAIPQFTRIVIDTATGAPTGLNDPTGEKLVLVALAFIGLAIVQQIVSIGATFLGETVAWSATNELRSDLMEHCLNLDARFYLTMTPGALIERLDSDVSLLANFFSQFFIHVMGSLLLTIGILAVLFIQNSGVGLLFALYTVGALLVLYRVRNIAVNPHKALREANTQLSGFLEERLAGTEDLRSSGAADYVTYGLFRQQARIRSRWQRLILFQSLLNSTAGIILTIGFATAFIAGYFLFSAGAITLGGVYLIMSYMTLLNFPLRTLTEQVESLQNMGASLSRIDELLSITSAIQDPAPDTAETIPAGALSLDFDHVQFAYQPDNAVLDDVTFSLQPQEVLGIVGRTGSGKTSIARLLFRLYDIQRGSIRLNGVAVHRVPIRALRRRVALVTQDVQLFEGTIRENLTFFQEHISDTDMLSALQEVELGEWLASLSAGLDTVLEAGGRNLSAGEGQLLAFARTLLRQPDLIILDEASSRLDPTTEARIERTMDKLLKGRTAIIIAHRLATLNRADKILLLENSRVLEYGERQQLADNPDSRFHQLLQVGEGALSS